MMRCRRQGTNGAEGATLVEILMAVVLLSTLAVAGGTFFYYGRTTVANQRNRLVALELASSRLEELRASPRAAFSNVAAATPYYLVLSSNHIWQVSSTPITQTMNLDGHAFSVQTQVGWTHTNRYLLDIEVQIAYRSDPLEAVTLETYYAPLD